MKTLIALAFACVATFTAARAADSKIDVVAAENFYGNVAQQIGGDRVSVTSVLSNPDQDPHLFEVSPAIIRQVVAAQIVVYNGADYDPWIERLLKVATKPARVAIVAADLVNKKAGDNPHLWYDPATMPAVASALAAALAAADPAHKDDYAARLKTFLASLGPLNEKIAAIRRTVAEVATAPVLSKLYGTDIEVVHAEGHIFVLSRGRDVERSDHTHDDGQGYEHHRHGHHHHT